MEIIFTLDVHFAEYTQKNGTGDEQYGELSYIPVIIDRGIFSYEFEVKNRIKELAEEYSVDEDSIEIISIE